MTLLSSTFIVLIQLVNSIPFFNYSHERSIPFRTCDFFDELVARFASNPEEFDGKSNTLFSRPHIEELAEELLNMVSGMNYMYNVAHCKSQATPSLFQLAII